MKHCRNIYQHYFIENYALEDRVIDNLLCYVGKYGKQKTLALQECSDKGLKLAGQDMEILCGITGKSAVRTIKLERSVSMILL